MTMRSIACPIASAASSAHERSKSSTYECGTGLPHCQGDRNRIADIVRDREVLITEPHQIYKFASVVRNRDFV